MLTEIFTLSIVLKFNCFCIRQDKCQVMFLFRLSASTLSLLQKPSVNIFRTECLPRHQSMLQRRLIYFLCLAFFFKSFASSFQNFPCLVKFFVVDNAYDIFAVYKTFLASSFCLRNSPSKLTLTFCPSVFVLVFPDVIFNGLS